MRSQQGWSPFVFTTLLACTGDTQEPTPAEVEAKRPARTLALLVGIDDYAQPAARSRQLGRLLGAQHDIRRVRELLLDRFGFERDSIVTLTGREATHEAIVRKFHEHLIQRAGPDTQVVFWFSGHGSRVPDTSRKDTGERMEGDDPYDDTMLAYDSRAGDRHGCYDLTDDELHSLLAALRSDHVLVVTDCCHSGSLTRGNGAGVRAAGDGEQPLDLALINPFWPAAAAPFRDDDRGEATRSHLHVAACGSLEEAGEYEDQESGNHYGTLTFFLTGLLREVDARTSWQAALETVRARMAGCGTRGSQLVQWGPPERAAQAILGGIGKQLPVGYEVRHGSRSDFVIEAGRIHGVVEGSELRMLDLDGQERGCAKVERARATNCDASWSSAGERPQGVALRAVPGAALEGRRPLGIRLGAGVDGELLAKCPWAIARPRAGDDFDYELMRQGEQFELRRPDGTFARTFAADAAALHQHLFKVYSFRALWEGVIQPGQARVEVAVAPATKERCAEYMKVANEKRRKADRPELTAPQRAANVHRVPGSADALVGSPWLEDDYGTGGMVEITVTNRSADDLYVAVLSVTEDHGVNLIWGNRRDNQLAPGASHDCLVEVGPVRSWQLLRPMIDRYIVIATPRYADFKAFEYGPTLLRSGETKDDDPPEFLARALDGGQTRGGDGKSGANAPAWGITWLDLRLVPVEEFDKLATKR